MGTEYTHDSPQQTNVGVRTLDDGGVLPSLARLRIRLLGYDAFISYAHRDGTELAIHLEHRLRSEGWTIFRDARELPVGADLDATIEWALGRSRMLILIGTPGACASAYVDKEVSQFSADRTLFTIDVGKAMAETHWQKVADSVRLEVEAEAFGSKPKLDRVLERIEHARDFRRRSTIARWLLTLFIALVVVLSVGLLYQVLAVVEERDAKKAALIEVTEQRNAKNKALDRVTVQRDEARKVALASQVATLALQMEGRDSTKAFRLLARARAIAETPAIRKLIRGWYSTRTFYARQLPHPGHRVGELRWGSSGLLVANGSTTTLWDPARWEGRDLEHRGALAWIQGERRFAASSLLDGTVDIFDVANGERLVGLKVGDQLSAAAVSADGQHALTLTANSGAITWDMLKVPPRPTPIVDPGLDEKHLGETAVFFGDSQAFAFAVEGGRVFLGQVGRRSGEWLEGHRDDVTALAVSSDGSLLLSGSRDETATLTHLKTGVEQHLQGQFSPIQAVAFSPDGTRVATGSSDGRIIVWNPAGDPLVWIDAHRDGVAGLAFSPDGRWLASGGVSTR